MPLFLQRLLLVSLLIVSFRTLGGTIKGTVTDKQGGDPIVGAVVVLQGTTYGTATGLDGSFLLKDIPAGAYDLEIRYFSFETFRQHITVGDTTVIVNHQLAPLASELNEVAITGKLKNGSEEQALSIEKNSDNLVNVMSARTIELLPDITVANVLQRVSGVQVQRDANGEARYALIRGMDKRYNYTEVDGVKIPSPDDKGRYVPLDVFPAEIVDRIEVIKTLTPDMEGDAIGGVTNLVMRQAPDHFVVYATAATGANANLLSQDFTGFYKGSITNYDPEKLYGSGYQATLNNFSFASSELHRMPAPADGLFSLAIGNRFLKKKLGVMFAGSYQNTYKETNNLFFVPDAQPGTGNIPAFDDIEIRKYYTEEARTGLHGTVDYKINDRNKITLTGLFVQLNQWEERNTIDTAITNVNRPAPGYGKVDLSDRTAFRQDRIGNVTLKGEHLVASDVKIDWTGAYSVATRSVPDMSDLHTSNTIEINPTTGTPYPDSTTFSSISKSWEKTQDQDMRGFVNVTYRPSFLDKLELKAGAMASSKDRNNYYNSYSFDPVTSNQLYTGVPNLNSSNTLLTPPDSGEAYQNPLTYHVHENIFAYYVQAKYYMLDNRLEILGGVRVEHTHIDDSIDVSPEIQAGVAGIYDYWDVLPSLHLKYKLNSKQNLRLSYFESISRPGFFELTGYKFTGEEFDEYGNPNLNHSVAQNVDARYEWFPKGLDELLGGVFFKDIFNPIEYGLVRLTGPSAQQLQPQNLSGPGAINYGAELAITKYFHSFGITGNYTYTHSAVTVPTEYQGLSSTGSPVTSYVNETRPLQGQAANIGNLALIYRNQPLGIDAHLTLQYTGRYISMVTEWAGLEYWQRGMAVMGFSCEKRIVKHLSVYAKINNLLNTPSEIELTYSNADYKTTALANGKPNPSFLPYQNLSDGRLLVEKSTYGQSYLVGVRYKFD